MGKATQGSTATRDRPLSASPIGHFFRDLLFGEGAPGGAAPRAPSSSSGGDLYRGPASGPSSLSRRGPSGPRQWPVEGAPAQNDAWGGPQTVTGGYGAVFGGKPHDAQGRPLNTGADVTARAGAMISPVVGGQVGEVRK